MAFAGETETFLGSPPKFASPRLPGVCTESVGVPLSLLCLEMKRTSSRFWKNSVMFCVCTDSWFNVMSLTFLLPISVV